MRFDRELARKAESALYMVALCVTLAVVLSGCGIKMGMSGAQVGAGFDRASMAIVVDPSRAHGQRYGETRPPLVSYDREAMRMLNERIEAERAFHAAYR